MAKRVVLTDDYDGSDIAEDDGGSVTFSIGDEYFEMDLSSKNLAKLTKAMQPFIDRANAVDPPAPEPVRRGRPATRRTQVPGAGREFLQEVRTWARANGYDLSDRGRIAAPIMEAFEASHK